jgi:signal peptidase I
VPPSDEPGRRYRAPRHGEPDGRWGGPGAVDPADDPYGDVSAARSASGGRHGTPEDAGPRHGEGGGHSRFAESRPAGPRHGGSDLSDPPGGSGGPAPWPPPTALPSSPLPSGSSSRFGAEDDGRDPLPSRFGADGYGTGYGDGPLSPSAGSPSDGYRPGSPGASPSSFGQAPLSPPYGQSYGQPSSSGQSPSSYGPSSAPSFGQAPLSPPYGQAQSHTAAPGQAPPYGQGPPSFGQAPLSPPYGQSQSYGQPSGRGPSSPNGSGQNGYAGQNGQNGNGQNGHAGPGGYGSTSYGSSAYDPRTASAGPPGGVPGNGAPGNGAPGNGAPGNGQGPPAAGGPSSDGAPGRPGTNGAGSTAVQPTAAAQPTAAQPTAAAQPTNAAGPLLAGGIPPPGSKREDARGAAGSRAGGATDDDAEDPGTGALGANPARHRRGGAAAGPGRGDDADDTSGPGRRARGKNTDDDGTGGKRKRKGSFWRELPLLVVVAIVLTFVIQTFVARIYVIPSASMEQTLHGCDGCANDRVAVDKVSYRFGDPSPGDVVVFKGPPAWLDNDEVGDEQPSSNPLIRGFQDALSLVGLAAPNEKDFVKRVIATGGQTVACCDAENHVLVNGKPINEPYLYYQPGLGDKQATFDPVRVPDGQLWVMGDNRNNSADARFHGPVPVSDVIGKVRVVVLPISRWRTVPQIDPQATTTALGGPEPIGTGTAGAAAGALLAVPVVGVGRRLRRAAVVDTSTAAPPGPPPGDDPPADDGGDAPTAETDRE